MKLLFEIDAKDYDINGEKYVRPSVRSIIIKQCKVAMVYSQKYNYYKFPGGGIEQNESHTDALVRETLEEVGLVVIPSSIREFGYVHRVQKGKREEVFIQDSFYYFCDVENDVCVQKLDEYEADENFTLKFVEPRAAINTNRFKFHGPKDKNMIEREIKVLELLLKDSGIK